MNKQYLRELLDECGWWKVCFVLANAWHSGFISRMEMKQWYRWIQPYALRKHYERG